MEVEQVPGASYPGVVVVHGITCCPDRSYAAQLLCKPNKLSKIPKPLSTNMSTNLVVGGVSEVDKT